MSADPKVSPEDLHQLLDVLRPLGWLVAHRPGLHLPEGKGGLSWIRPDGPGRAWGYGAIQFDSMPLAEVPALVKRRMGR